MLVIRGFEIRRLGRRHIRVACAFFALGGLFGWLFGIVPSFEEISRMRRRRGKRDSYRGL
jgi:hypothetical protein